MMNAGKLTRYLTGMRAKLVLLVLCLALLVAYFQWGVDGVYRWAAAAGDEENRQLAVRLAEARAELARLSDTAPVDEDELARALEALDLELARIPADVNINHVVRDILEIGQDCRVLTIPLSTSEPRTVIINEYQVISWDFSLLIEGSFQDIARFIGRIDGTDIDGATVEYVSVLPIASGNKTDTLPNYAVPARGNIDMVIYARDAEAGYAVP